jgi:hypothetical protein
LPTYRCGNGSREAVDGETAWSVLEDDGGSFWCSSGSSSSIGGIDGGAPSRGSLTREVLIRRGDSAGSGGYDGQGWGKIRTGKGLFIGGK